MKYINRIFIFAQMFIILSCSTQNTKLENSSLVLSASENTKTQSVQYFVKYPHDDAEEGVNGKVDLTNNDLDLGQLSGFESAKVIGIRFEEINLDKGQEIKGAFLQFTMEGNKKKAKPTVLTIRGELSPNAESFKNEANNISSRELTKASIKWTPKPWNPEQANDQKPKTPDLSEIIQEVVNQDDWQNRNALVLIITGTGERDAVSFDGGGKKEGPILHINPL